MCEDVWHDDYEGAPSNGSAWLEGGNTYFHVVRGGSWLSFPQDVRSAFRAKASAILRIDNLGFRIGRTLTLEQFMSESAERNNARISMNCDLPSPRPRLAAGPITGSRS